MIRFPSVVRRRCSNSGVVVDVMVRLPPIIVLPAAGIHISSVTRSVARSSQHPASHATCCSGDGWASA